MRGGSNTSLLDLLLFFIWEFVDIYRGIDSFEVLIYHFLDELVRDWCLVPEAQFIEILFMGNR